jgi:hypothetical protein
MRPSEAEVHAALDRAINELVLRDHHLLESECSERSITHHLAVYLAAEFPRYNVDCEYNRDGFDVKRLKLGERKVKVSDDELDAVTVFPDVVVHQRGTNVRNLLVIEVKKAVSRADLAEYDIRKLQAFKAELGYVHAAHVVLGYSRNQTLERAVAWQ